MTQEDIFKRIRESQLPVSFPLNLNIGECCCMHYDDDWSRLVVYYPQMCFCKAFASIDKMKDLSEVTLYTHGIQIHVGDIRYNIHNSQIIIMEHFHINESVEYERSASRAERISAGIMLGGPIGAAIGLATSFGRGHTNLDADFLIVGYWNTETQEKEIIQLMMNKKGIRKDFSGFLEAWKNEKEINESTGRQAKGEEKSGISQRSGCMVSLMVGIIISLGAMLIL